MKQHIINLLNRFPSFHIMPMKGRSHLSSEDLAAATDITPEINKSQHNTFLEDNSKSLKEKFEYLFRCYPADLFKACLRPFGYAKENEIKNESLKNASHLLDVEGVKATSYQAGMNAARDEILLVLQACSLAGMEKQALLFIQQKMSIDDVRSIILENKAKQARETQIRSSISALNTEGMSPLIADALKRTERMISK